MNQLLDVAYERYEYQFSTLLESIAANNPSPQAALDLIAADDELSQALAQRMSHYLNLQANYQLTLLHSSPTPGKPQAHTSPKVHRRSARREAKVCRGEACRFAPRALRNTHNNIPTDFATSHGRRVAPECKLHLQAHCAPNISRAGPRRR